MFLDPIKRLLCFNCPKCNTGVLLLNLNFKGWKSGLFHCNNCGAKLKLSNGLFIATLYGLFCGALIVSTRYWEFGSEWIRFAIVIAICWFVVWPIFCQLLGRWRIVPDPSELTRPSPKSRKWSRLANLSFWLSCISIISVSIMWWFVTNKLQDYSSKADENSELANRLIDKAFNLSHTAVTIGFGCVLLGVIFFTIGVFCHIKAKRNMTISSSEFENPQIPT